MRRTRSDIAWLAGLIEGEGSFFKRSSNGKTRPSWCFSLEMADKDVVKNAAAIWGYGNVRKIPASQRTYSLGTKDMYVWRFEDRSQIYALLVAIYPWLGIRRKERAREALKNLPPTPPYKRGPKILMKPKQIAEAVSLRDSGYSYREIASILGCSFSTVYRRLSVACSAVERK